MTKKYKIKNTSIIKLTNNIITLVFFILYFKVIICLPVYYY